MISVQFCHIISSSSIVLLSRPPICFSLKVTHRSAEQTDRTDAAEQLDEQDPPDDEEDVDSTEGADGLGKLIVVWSTFLQSYS